MGALLENGAKHLQGGGVHGPKGRQRIQHQLHAHLRELGGGEQWRLAKLGDVGQHRHLDRRSKRPVVLQRCQRFCKDHVGPGCHIGARALDGRSQALHGMGIGARHDDELMIGPGIQCCLEAVDHLGGTHQRLAWPVSAALDSHLVLEVHAGHAGTDHGLCGPGHGKGPAEAGVHVHQQRQRRCGGDARGFLGHLGQRGHGEIRQSEGGIGHTGPGEIQRPGTTTLRQHGAVGVDHPENLQGGAFLNRLAQARPGRHGRSISAVFRHGYGASRSARTRTCATTERASAGP